MEPVFLDPKEASKFTAACVDDDANLAMEALESAVARNSIKQDCWVNLRVSASLDGQSEIAYDVLFFAAEKTTYVFKAILNFIFEPAAFLSLPESIRSGRTASSALCLGVYVRRQLERDPNLDINVLTSGLQPMLLTILSRAEDDDIHNIATMLTRQIGENLDRLVEKAPGHRTHLQEREFSLNEAKEIAKVLEAAVSEAATEVKTRSRSI
jgi:hypothetical protein